MNQRRHRGVMERVGRGWEGNGEGVGRGWWTTRTRGKSEDIITKTEFGFNTRCTSANNWFTFSFSPTSFCPVDSIASIVP